MWASDTPGTLEGRGTVTVGSVGQAILQCGVIVHTLWNVFRLRINYTSQCIYCTYIYTAFRYLINESTAGADASVEAR